MKYIMYAGNKNRIEIVLDIALEPIRKKPEFAPVSTSLTNDAATDVYSLYRQDD